ncbi:MAG TPA: SAM-dependent methyltransferase [Geobacter sp.]|nr:SAM-dependent methyltransferase [Geobacter sp.]
MHMIPPKKGGLEFLDLPPDVCSMEELEGSLADLRVVNRYLGDKRALLKHLAAKARGADRLTVLDIATGSADLPVAIVEWARKEGIGVSVTAIDINNRSIAIARRQTARYPEISLLVADGLNLPFPDKSFDIVMCTKTVHHMKDPEAIGLVREILRVAKRGYIIIDIRRSWIAYWLIYLLTRLFSRNRMTRFDGPLSVLKSYTPAEFAVLATSAGASGFRIHREPFWLLVLSGEVG